LSQSVFVLEDDADIARLVQHHLEAAGFEARLFHTPTNLIPDAERKAPALFLLDIMVPGGDGLDVCRRLRNHAGLSTVPIIFLTARAGENDRVLGLELGADDYITKPFSTRELVARVKAVLRQNSVCSITSRGILGGFSAAIIFWTRCGAMPVLSRHVPSMFMCAASVRKSRSTRRIRAT
jgi:DNA-binding response OmpR family regulator